MDFGINFFLGFRPFGLAFQKYVYSLYIHKSVSWTLQNKFSFVFVYALNPKDTGGVGIHTRHPIDQIAPYLGIGSGPLVSLNSSRSIPVILPPFWGPSDARLNSDIPGKSMDYQIGKAEFFFVLITKSIKPIKNSPFKKIFKVQEGGGDYLPP